MSSLGVLINGSSDVVSRDIIKDVSKPITNTDYFDIVITDLKPSTSYNVQFAWVYPDDTRSDYSATYTFSTDAELAPAIPSTPSVSAGPGLINVTWNGNKASGGSLTNYAKVNIYVDGVLRDFFLAAGTKSIALAKGTYSITLRSSSSTNVISDPSTAASATITTDATDAAAAQSSANSALAQLATKLNTAATGILAVDNNITAINTNGITLFSNNNGSATSVPTNGARIVMNFEGLAGFDSSNNATFAIKPTSWNYTVPGTGEIINVPAGSAIFSGIIAAASIRGGSLSTSISGTGARIELSTSYSNQIRFHAASAEVARVSSATDGIGNYLWINHQANGSSASIRMYSDTIILGGALRPESSQPLGSMRLRGIDTASASSSTIVHNSAVSDSTLNPQGSIIILYQS